MYKILNKMGLISEKAAEGIGDYIRTIRPSAVIQGSKNIMEKEEKKKSDLSSIANIGRYY